MRFRRSTIVPAILVVTLAVGATACGGAGKSPQAPRAEPKSTSPTARVPSASPTAKATSARPAARVTSASPTARGDVGGRLPVLSQRLECHHAGAGGGGHRQRHYR